MASRQGPAGSGAEAAMPGKGASQDVPAPLDDPGQDAAVTAPVVEKEEAAGPAGKAAEAEAEPEPELPPLTPQEFRAYNRLSEHMNYYHEHFRSTWNLLYGACCSGRRPANMSLKQFIDEGLQFVHHLTMHHNIEETYLFPILARKMPEFQTGTGSRSGAKGGARGKAAELLQQHRMIHAGMDEFEAYLQQCRNREVELELSVLKTKMDSWNQVLWTHLDQEVRTLGAENMRRYWTLEELRSLPM